MGIIGIILLVAFVIVCVLIVILVLLQNEDGGGLGGLFAGGSNSAFGSRSANVLTKATYVVVTLFFVGALLLALLNRSPGDQGLEEAARIQQAESATDANWYDAPEATVDTIAAPEAETAPTAQ